MAHTVTSARNFQFHCTNLRFISLILEEVSHDVVTVVTVNVVRRYRATTTFTHYSSFFTRYLAWRGFVTIVLAEMVGCYSEPAHMFTTSARTL